MDVAAAVNFIHPLELVPSENPYLQWRMWKEKEETERLAALMGEDEQESRAALLSYFSEPCSSDMSMHFHALLQHPSDKIRAVSIILLSEHSMPVTGDELRRLMKDASRYVRMGALHACDRYPDLWDELSNDVVRFLLMMTMTPNTALFGWHQRYKIDSL